MCTALRTKIRTYVRLVALRHNQHLTRPRPRLRAIIQSHGQSAADLARLRDPLDLLDCVQLGRSF